MLQANNNVRYNHEIIVKAANGKVIHVNVELTVRVEELKMKIEEIAHIPTTLFHLISYNTLPITSFL